LTKTVLDVLWNGNCPLIFGINVADKLNFMPQSVLGLKRQMVVANIILLLESPNQFLALPWVT